MMTSTAANEHAARPGNGAVGAQTAAPVVSNLAFLSALCPSLDPMSETWWACAFPGDPYSDEAHWFGQAVTATSGHPGRISANSFFSVGTIKRGDGHSRRKADFGRLFVVPLDDVAGGLPLPATYVLQTSPKKFQAGYRLAEPIADPKLADRLMQELVRSGRIQAVDRGGCNITRYVRLPVGCNTKKGHVAANGGRPFPHELLEWHPERAYTAEEIAQAFGLDLTPAPPSPKAEPRPGIDTRHALLLGLLHASGLYKRDLGDGRHDITCPWVTEHTNSIDNGAVYFDPSAEHPEGGFKCQHGHCAERHLADLRRQLGPSVHWRDEEPEQHERSDARGCSQDDDREPGRASGAPGNDANHRDGEEPTGGREGAPPDYWRKILSDSYCRFTVEDLLTDPEPQRFVLFPYIPEGTVTVLAGPGSSGKTTLLTFVAVARAQSLPFFGGATPAAGDTAIFTTEDRREDYLRKLAALRVDLGDAFRADLIAERVHFFDLSGVPVRMVEANKGNFYPTPVPDALADVLRERAPRVSLVIMETVSRLAGGIETNESLSILVESAQRVCRLTGAAVLLVAHTSQEAARGGFTDAYTPRGGSALGDNGRSTMVLTRLNAENRKVFAPDAELTPEEMERLLVLAHAKSNGAPAAAPLLLERGSTRHGPVLRPAVLTAKETDPATLMERLVALVADLLGKKEVVTARRLSRDHAAELKCSRREVEDLVKDALDSGALVQDGKANGGGFLLKVGVVQ
jgi:hypothetical protein